MSYIKEMNRKKITTPYIRSRKGISPIVAITAYDYPSARLADEAGVDIILVGDSLAQTVLGYDTTLPITLDEMISAAKAVHRANPGSLVVGDMPFGTYHDSVENAVESAIRFVKQGGVEAVKIEGGRRRFEIVQAIVHAEVPVMGHIGLTPQSVLKMGGYKVQGKTIEAARELIEDALSLQSAGVFSIVIEGVPAEISRLVTERVTVPTIGIGAGPFCDGQILVFNDVIGLTFGHQAKFVRQYTNARENILDALKQYSSDVSSGRYPADVECYHLPENVVLELGEEQSESMPPLGPVN
jgi:3-methyl-2-oxobutanoate hydroxymethyltransferase